MDKIWQGLRELVNIFNNYVYKQICVMVKVHQYEI